MRIQSELHRGLWAVIDKSTLRSFGGHLTVDPSAPSVRLWSHPSRWTLSPNLYLDSASPCITSSSVCVFLLLCMCEDTQSPAESLETGLLSDLEA